MLLFSSRCKKCCFVPQTSTMSPFIKKSNSISTKQLLNQSVAETNHYINKCWSVEIAWLLTWAGEVSWYAADKQFGLLANAFMMFLLVEEGSERKATSAAFGVRMDHIRIRLTMKPLVLPLSLRSWMVSITREGISMKQESNVFKRMDFQKKIHLN